MVSAIESQLVFPGRHAGASLKQRQRDGGRGGARHVFPGRHAGASLKHDGVLIPFAKIQEFSPADTPGPH